VDRLAGIVGLRGRRACQDAAEKQKHRDDFDSARMMIPDESGQGTVRGDPASIRVTPQLAGGAAGHMFVLRDRAVDRTVLTSQMVSTRSVKNDCRNTANAWIWMVRQLVCHLLHRKCPEAAGIRTLEDHQLLCNIVCMPPGQTRCCSTPPRAPWHAPHIVTLRSAPPRAKSAFSLQRRISCRTKRWRLAWSSSPPGLAPGRADG
jgi:hypothetical protein